MKQSEGSNQLSNTYAKVVAAENAAKAQAAQLNTHQTGTTYYNQATGVWQATPTPQVIQRAELIMAQRNAGNRYRNTNLIYGEHADRQQARQIAAKARAQPAQAPAKTSFADMVFGRPAGAQSVTNTDYYAAREDQRQRGVYGFVGQARNVGGSWYTKDSLGKWVRMDAGNPEVASDDIITQLDTPETPSRTMQAPLETPQGEKRYIVRNYNQNRSNGDLDGVDAGVDALIVRGSSGPEAMIFEGTPYRTTSNYADFLDDIPMITPTGRNVQIGYYDQQKGVVEKANPYGGYSYDQLASMYGQKAADFIRNRGMEAGGANATQSGYISGRDVYFSDMDRQADAMIQTGRRAQSAAEQGVAIGQNMAERTRYPTESKGVGYLSEYKGQGNTLYWGDRQVNVDPLSMLIYEKSKPVFDWWSNAVTRGNFKDRVIALSGPGMAIGALSYGGRTASGAAMSLEAMLQNPRGTTKAVVQGYNGDVRNPDGTSRTLGISGGEIANAGIDALLTFGTASFASSGANLGRFNPSKAVSSARGVATGDALADFITGGKSSRMDYATTRATAPRDMIAEAYLGTRKASNILTTRPRLKPESGKSGIDLDTHYFKNTMFDKPKSASEDLVESLKKPWYERDYNIGSPSDYYKSVTQAPVTKQATKQAMATKPITELIGEEKPASTKFRKYSFTDVDTVPDISQHLEVHKGRLFVINPRQRYDIITGKTTTSSKTRQTYRQRQRTTVIDDLIGDTKTKTGTKSRQRRSTDVVFVPFLDEPTTTRTRPTTRTNTNILPRTWTETSTRTPTTVMPIPPLEKFKIPNLDGAGEDKRAERRGWRKINLTNPVEKMLDNYIGGDPFAKKKKTTRRKKR